MRLKTRRMYLIGAVLLVMALTVAGCGRGGGGGAAGGREEPAVPTMPAAQFAQPTTMITVAAGDAVTETSAAEAGTPEAPAESAAAINETAATTETASTGAANATPASAGGEMTADQKRGKELYTTRKCGECHGANAEGVPDKGSAVAGTALSLEEFTDLIRTGGEIGPDHLFGPMTISPSGVTAIHAWLQSLPAE